MRHKLFRNNDLGKTRIRSDGGSTNRRPSTLILILRGIAQGVSTARLARELDCDRMKLLELRHKLQDHALAGLDPTPLSDPIVEADECYVNAGEKRYSALRAG